MSSEKRVRTPNEFNGMSLEQLQHKADVCHMMIDNAKREIKRYQKEIEKQESIVKDYTNALRRIETAKNKVGDIEYITILVVWVKIERLWKYPDKPYRGYYSVSDWKSVLIYNFAVNKVNKNDGQNRNYLVKLIIIRQVLVYIIQVQTRIHLFLIQTYNTNQRGVFVQIKRKNYNRLS